MNTDFRDVGTGKYFMYRSKLYMKCCNSHDKYPEGFNTWLADKWTTKQGQIFFDNDTKVEVCEKQTYHEIMGSKL